jgi:hypothetical protein
MSEEGGLSGLSGLLGVVRVDGVVKVVKVVRVVVYRIIQNQGNFLPQNIREITHPTSQQIIIKKTIY